MSAEKGDWASHQHFRHSFFSFFLRSTDALFLPVSQVPGRSLSLARSRGASGAGLRLGGRGDSIYSLDADTSSSRIPPAQVMNVGHESDYGMRRCREADMCIAGTTCVR